MERISRSATITLHGPVETVFPLFGPVREMDWAEGWSPEVLFGRSEAEEKMIFRTPSKYEDEEHYLWVISKYERDRYLVEYMVSGKDRIWFINVMATGTADVTTARVEYTYTGFTTEAVARNLDSLANMFREELIDWQDAINHFLLTGEKLNHNLKI